MGKKGGKTTNISQHQGIVVTDGGTASGNTLIQNNAGLDGIDLEKLGGQLAQLRAAMKLAAAEISSDDADESIGAIASAEKAAKAGDGSKVVSSLKAAGNWALDVATKIGVGVAQKAIESALGIPKP